MNKNTIKEIFTIFAQHNPSPTTELIYANTFQLLISVILSAQSTDIAVNKATKDLFTKVYTAPDMLIIGKEELTKHIKSIGLYTTKANNIIKTCTMIIEKFNGQVPNNREDLEQLAGVGRKTANVVLNTAFGQPTIAVDTHIFRVSNRTKIAIGKTPLQVEEQLIKRIPTEFKLNAHHWLILHGRYICKARNPQCNECIIKNLCEYTNK